MGSSTETEIDYAAAQIIDSEVAELTSLELAGGYTALCGGMFAKTCFAIGNPPTRKTEAENRQTARQWVAEKTQGVVSFKEACICLDLSLDAAEEGIDRYAETRLLEAINKSSPKRPKNHYVFGVKKN
jgi:hypothetical protein